ncbi:metal ABC transporter permease [Anoxynatronum buryatiense]|uniref:Manganese/zinc/iron transport system permease protein n=1 Tax=Anoxynatronum buryatiense TaxID=489973 RepID=A0AA46AJU7_9CLOT|nr:manganese/zinc/iron transport system permease protein [Anoxynatronum buryatiense]
MLTSLGLDYTLLVVSAGSGLLGLVSGVLGVFAVLRKQSLLGDAVAHAALPGIALMFLLTQTRQTELLLLGATLTGVLATGTIIAIDRFSRIKYDSALALILSVFFGFGLVLITFIQKIPTANQAGLDKFIFGQASTMLVRDVRLMIWVTLLMLGLTVLFWKELKMFSFDPGFTEVAGFSTRRINALLSGMIVVAIMIGLQTVGVILMSALIVAPGAAARQWSDRLSVVALLAGFFGAVSGLIGTLISSSITKMPTGPTIVIVLSLFTLISLLLAPNRGLLWQHLRQRKNQQMISYDKVLTAIHELAMNHENHQHTHAMAMIQPSKNIAGKPSKALQAAVENLEQRGLVRRNEDNQVAITPEGIRHVNRHLVKGDE